MGHSHALTGAVVGLLVADALPNTGVVAAALLSLGTAGAALLPDLDHPSATASHALGPVTRALARGLGALSARVYVATKTRLDPPRQGGHRLLTHTLAFAVLAGLGALGLASLPSPWAPATVTWALVSLALHALLPRGLHARSWPASALLAATAVGGLTIALGPVTLPWLPALATSLGCLTHDLGDGLTDSGVPLLAPLPLGGRRWARLGTPHVMRFHTGGPVELRVITPLAWLALGGAVALPLLTR